jgi:hypothetical protein
MATLLHTLPVKLTLDDKPPPCRCGGAGCKICRGQA